ncbi:ABC transporter substrate-binding protein [Phaeobacter sp. B1627]|uniref:ABC transporter substrate-binding protein n=1 Tax=Phaeobacter sp. B1627 TaxID=2583809 RepID=UPI00111BA081|nr:ABC transporter substrate-binding protein [Phaeobacter sp. B1627]TNJ43299.1 ABC transporter substrate-binding protein [Phaeobacter sp. B1627]
MVSRRRFLAHGAALLCAPSLARAGGREVVDVLGNVVRLKAAPQRILLLDASDYYMMAALLPDPGGRIVGWASAARLDLGAQAERLGAVFPEVGGISPDTVSVEAILGLEPDLVVTSAYMSPQTATLAQHLENAGIPVAWSGDYGQSMGPQEKLQRSLGFWGELLDQQARAGELRDQSMARFDALTAAPAPGPLPRVYMEIMTTYDSCCWAAGRAFWGDLFQLAGGDLLAGSDGWGAQLSPEGLLGLNPEVYIATGGNFAPGLQPAIGPGLDPEQGRSGLRKAADRQGLRNSDAVVQGRIHGIWSGLISSPLFGPLLAECLAKWLHPEHFRELDPVMTLAALNRYFPAPLPGPLWASLGEA